MSTCNVKDTLRALVEMQLPDNEQLTAQIREEVVKELESFFTAETAALNLTTTVQHNYAEPYKITERLSGTDKVTPLRAMVWGKAAQVALSVMGNPEVITLIQKSVVNYMTNAFADSDNPGKIAEATAVPFAERMMQAMVLQLSTTASESAVLTIASAIDALISDLRTNGVQLSYPNDQAHDRLVSEVFDTQREHNLRGAP